MITKDQLCAAMTKECDIAVHLFSKLPPDSYDYRPGPNQRSTTELLRYMSLCATAGIESMEKSNFKLFGEIMARNTDMKPEDFPAEMQKQKAGIEKYFSGLSEEKLENQESMIPGGGKAPLQVALLNGPLKWLTGYKLQLFMYAKASGNGTIGTANMWGGFDWPPPTQS